MEAQRDREGFDGVEVGGDTIRQADEDTAGGMHNIVVLSSVFISTVSASTLPQPGQLAASSHWKGMKACGSLAWT